MSQKEFKITIKIPLPSPIDDSLGDCLGMMIARGTDFRQWLPDDLFHNIIHVDADVTEDKIITAISLTISIRPEGEIVVLKPGPVSCYPPEVELWGTRPDNRSRHSELGDGWPCVCGHTSSIHEYNSKLGRGRCNAPIYQNGEKIYCRCRGFAHAKN